VTVEAFAPGWFRASERYASGYASRGKTLSQGSSLTKRKRRALDRTGDLGIMSPSQAYSLGERSMARFTVIPRTYGT